MGLVGMHKKRITKNMARCGSCRQYVESKHDHDFRSCKCGNLTVDGGRSYLRRLYRSDNWTEMSQYEGDPPRILEP